MHGAWSRIFMWACLGVLVGCGDGGSTGIDGSVPSDAAGATDGGARDGAADDAASIDTGAADAGTTDAGSVDAGSADATTMDTGGPVEFTLTSAAFLEGGVIPRTHACTSRGGTNTSPPLEWTGAPAGTLSFAVFFRDTDIDFAHAAIYDIPNSRTGLPSDVDHSAMPVDVPGASQPLGYLGGSRYGYEGPCPGSMHTYRFTLYALDVAMLPAFSVGDARDLERIEAAFIEHSIGSATLSGSFTP